MGLRSLTNFEKRCLTHEIITRKRLNMPPGNVEVFAKGEALLLRVKANSFIPNEIRQVVANPEISIDAHDLVIQIVGQLGKDRHILVANRNIVLHSHEYNLELPSPVNYSGIFLLNMFRIYDAAQKRENFDKYLANIKKRQEFHDNYGKDSDE